MATVNVHNYPIGKGQPDPEFGQKGSYQPFSVAQRFTGREGKYVPRSETVRGFKEILEGKHDDLPEQAFYMVGTIDEARQQGDEMKKRQ